MFDIFDRRKKKKILAEFRARRHAEDDLLTPAQRQNFDVLIAGFAESPLRPADSPGAGHAWPHK